MATTLNLNLRPSSDMDNPLTLDKVCRSAYVPLVRLENIKNHQENKASTIAMLSDEVHHEAYVFLTRLENSTIPRKMLLKGKKVLAGKENSHVYDPQVSLKKLSQTKQLVRNQLLSQAYVPLKRLKNLPDHKKVFNPKSIVPMKDIIGNKAYVLLKRLEKLSDDQNPKSTIPMKKIICNEAHVLLKRLDNLADDQKVATTVSRTSFNDSLCHEAYVRLVRLENSVNERN